MVGVLEGVGKLASIAQLLAVTSEPEFALDVATWYCRWFRAISTPVWDFE